MTIALESGRALGTVDVALLVVIRQSVLIAALLLGLLAACITRHVASVHLWLETSWWLVATVTAAFVFVSNIFAVLTNEAMDDVTVLVLAICELVELGLYLVFALFASIGRRREGRRYANIRKCFWVATIFLVLLWSISSLLDIVSSGYATPGTVITMTATVITAVIMIADLWVTNLHDIDPTVTESQAHDAIHQPLLRDEEAGRGGHGPGVVKVKPGADENLVVDGKPAKLVSLKQEKHGKE